MHSIPWLEQSYPFLEYLHSWYEGLQPASLEAVVHDPAKVAIVSVDVTNGFCYEGPLSSPRVQRIIRPIVDLFKRAWALGVRNFLLPQDTHEPDAIEFNQFPPHCIRGTSEADVVPEIKALPFFDQMLVMEKNSIQSALNTGLEAWVRQHPEADRYIVVGDCTDFCVYQLAMHLRLEANASQIQRRVILPVNCVDTFDLPVATALEIGAVPHDAELLHRIFLYSMMQNGVEVVSSLG